MKLAGVLIVAVIALGAAGGALAQPPQPVKWSLALEPSAARMKVGGTFTAVVSAKIEQGWHIYGPDELPGGPRPLRVVVPVSQAFKAAGALKCPEPERDMDEAFGQVTAFYNSDTTFKLPIAVTSTAKPGQQVFAVEISFQACDGRMCLPARVEQLTKTVTLRK